MLFGSDEGLLSVDTIHSYTVVKTEIKLFGGDCKDDLRAQVIHMHKQWSSSLYVKVF